MFHKILSAFGPEEKALSTSLKSRHLKKVIRTKRMRKRKKKEKVETHSPTTLPTLLVPPQSEGDEMVDTKLALFSSQEDDSDLFNELGMRHGVVKFWACHISTEK